MCLIRRVKCITFEIGWKSGISLRQKRMYWLIEDVIMEFLPPGNERRMRY
jgi:hypothetical protein